MKEGEARLDPESQEDKQHARIAKLQRADAHIAGVEIDLHRAKEQQHARKDVQAEIAHAGLVGSARPRLEDQENRRDRRQLPEDKQADEIAAEGGRHGRAHIGQAH